MDNSEWNIYRLNEHDTVAAPSFKEAVEWYMQEYGLDREEAVDPYYEPHDRTTLETMWTGIEILTEDERKMTHVTKEFDGETFIQVTFARLLKESNSETPFVIATYEV